VLHVYIDYSILFRLFVVRGKSTVVFPKLFKNWNITKLTFEVDTDAPGRQRDAEVIKLANEAGVDVIQKVSHTLYNLDE
jgi:cryptochrome